MVEIGITGVGLFARRCRHSLVASPPAATAATAAPAAAPARTAFTGLFVAATFAARRIALASGVALDLTGVTPLELTGGEDHSLLASFPADAVLPGGFRTIGVVRAGEGLLVDGVPFEARGGWDPYEGWDGAAG